MRVCLLIVLLFALGSCSSSGGNLPVAFDRTTWPKVTTSLSQGFPGPEYGRPVTVQAPYQAYITVSVRPSSDDPAKFWTKAEVDYGDGNGWVDITPQALYFWKHNGLSTAAYVLKDFQPGEYHIRSRATYYDGAVLESRDHEEVYLTVLP